MPFILKAREHPVLGQVAHATEAVRLWAQQVRQRREFHEDDVRHTAVLGAGSDAARPDSRVCEAVVSGRQFCIIIIIIIVIVIVIIVIVIVIFCCRD
jgi:t-SNARE complex subunit (syntaxin)